MNASIQCYRYSSQHCFSCVPQLNFHVLYFHFHSTWQKTAKFCKAVTTQCLFLYPLRLPLWPMYSLEVCRLVSKCLKILLLLISSLILFKVISHTLYLVVVLLNLLWVLCVCEPTYGLFWYMLHRHRASLVAQLVKNLPTVWETWVWSLGWEDPLEKGKATHSSILAWRTSWTI